ncbi:MAG: dihydrolipoyl dehydrogenase family protein, partial [bacterium]
VVGAGNILIATGSRPKPLPRIPFDGDVVLSSDHAVQLKDIPERLLIVGGGTIGVEFAFIYAGLGSKVTLIEMLDRVLPTEDKDVSGIVEREMRKWGIETITGTKVDTLLGKKGGATVMLDDGSELTVNRVLLAIGRAYNTEALNLLSVGIKLREDRSIEVNEKLATNFSNVYAAGDCIGGKLLAHVASKEAIVAVENCRGTPRGVDYTVIPRCTFTVPEVASVGQTEEQARESGKGISVGRFDFRALGKAHADDEITGMIKIVADSETDKILGAHIVGHAASCLIHELVVAMKAGMRARDLGEVVHAHPTVSEAVMEAAADVQDASVHKPRLNRSL